MRLTYFVLAAGIATLPLHAVTIQVVPKGTTETAPITLDDERDGLIVEKGGAIEVTDEEAAVNIEASEQFVENNGRITTTSGTGFFTLGISNLGNAQGVFTNNGLIEATGTDGTGAEAIFNGEGADDAVITNSGEIRATSGSSFALGILNDNADDAVITNSGLIETIAENPGLSIGIQSQNSTNTQIINSGTIIAKSNEGLGFAISFFDSNPTLTLLRGSNLQGQVFSRDDPLNLNVETGLNLALTLNSAGMSFGELGIEAPFVRVGDVVGVIDPTGLAMQVDVLADLSDTILSDI
ncbi:MAG: hypothetical protein K940chlam9_01462, partial [Chlamydiae bacterium]|nr:hypothetical protein [Chlamydiota bacterium]